MRLLPSFGSSGGCLGLGLGLIQPVQPKKTPAATVAHRFGLATRTANDVVNFGFFASSRHGNLQLLNLPAQRFPPSPELLPGPDVLVQGE